MDAGNLRHVGAAPTTCNSLDALPLTAQLKVEEVMRNSVIFAAIFMLASCGEVGAPTKGEIKQVIQTRMQEANGKISANTLGIFDGPYDVKDFDVTNADCTAKDNGIYDCAVTSINKSQTKTGQLSFKKANGVWTLVE